MASNIVSGSFTSDTQSASFNPEGFPFALTLSNTFVATVTLQFSIDNGATWVDAVKDLVETPAEFTVPGRVIVDDPEIGVLYRLDADWTSGTVDYRLSQ